MPRRNRKRAIRTKQITFTHDLGTRVTVKKAEFVYLTTLRYLDHTRLNKGTHRIEVGYLKTPCGKRMVTARVTRGTITGVEIEPCTEAKPATPEVGKLLTAALKKSGAGGKAFLPIPFADFAAGRIDAGAHFPCVWIIVETPGVQQGTAFFCCLKTIDFGPIPIPVPICSVLPVPRA
jgi:hypothetical protein